VQKFGASVEECLSRYPGHPVVILVTAKWSPSCWLPVKLLETPEVGEAGLRHNAVFVLADLTVPNVGLDELQELHGQAGVPYLVIYHADHSKAPVIGRAVASAEGLAAEVENALKGSVP
jgi:thiol:disulfide interchange protein